MNAMPGLKWMWYLFFFGYALDALYALGVNSVVDSVKQIAFIIEDIDETEYADAQKDTRK